MQILGGPKGHLERDIQNRDFAVKLALDTSIRTALFKVIPQGKRCLDIENAI